MKIVFHPNVRDDYPYWQNTDSKTLKRINSLIRQFHERRTRVPERILEPEDRP